MTGGSRVERELRDLIKEKGYAAVREPASGGGNDRAAADVLAKIEGRLYAIELKYASNDYARFVFEDDVEGIIEFADEWQAIPLLAARFSRDTTFYLENPYNWRASQQTEKSMSMKRHQTDDWVTLDDLFVEGDPHVDEQPPSPWCIFEAVREGTYPTV